MTNLTDAEQALANAIADVGDKYQLTHAEMVALLANTLTRVAIMMMAKEQRGKGSGRHGH